MAHDAKQQSAPASTKPSTHRPHDDHRSGLPTGSHNRDPLRDLRHSGGGDPGGAGGVHRSAPAASPPGLDHVGVVTSRNGRRLELISAKDLITADEGTESKCINSIFIAIAKQNKAVDRQLNIGKLKGTKSNTTTFADKADYDRMITFVDPKTGQFMVIITRDKRTTSALIEDMVQHNSTIGCIVRIIEPVFTGNCLTDLGGALIIETKFPLEVCRMRIKMPEPIDGPEPHDTGRYKYAQFYGMNILLTNSTIEDSPCSFGLCGMASIQNTFNPLITKPNNTPTNTLLSILFNSRRTGQAK